MSSALLSALVRDAIGYVPLGSFDFSTNQNLKYPPHNIIKNGEDHYKLILAVAGFRKDQITVTSKNGFVQVVGIPDEDTPAGYTELYRGISNRGFDRSWKLGEYVAITKVELKDGILTISMERKVPDSMKAQTIDIE